MASNVLSEHSKEDTPNFTLKCVGKFWILKTKNTSKRLVFLDNAKDVVINDNIIIADEQLFEIHKNEKGQYKFRKLKDVTDETYFSIDKCLRENSEVTKEMVEKRDKIENESQIVDEEFYENLAKSVISESDTQTANCNQSRCSDPKMECSDAERTFLRDVKRTPVYVDEEYFKKVHEECKSFEFGSADADDDKGVVQMPSATSEGNEFMVEIEQSDLGKKLCDVEGKVILLIQDKEIVLKDPNSQSVKYSFPFKWMRRVGREGKAKFLFEVGRACPLGVGKFYCKTKEAKKVHKIIAQKILSLKE